MNLKRKLLFVFVTIITLPNVICGQNKPTDSKAIAEIFTDFHVNLNDTSNSTGFGVSRAYLGYNYIADEHFSAALIVNMGYPDDIIENTVRR
ncbi:hypothetical protein JZU68_00270, partial [bacterium]|nr:hypothetical protein [bacterium]